MDTQIPPTENLQGSSSRFVRLSRRHWDRERIAELLLILFGALLRLKYLRDFSGSPLYDLAIGADVREYYQRAQQLLNGSFFPVSPDIHAPLYPCFLALALKLCGGSIPAVRAVQTVLNFGAMLAFYALLKRENIRPKVRLTFLGVVMLFTVPVFYQAELVSESLLVPLAAAFFWARRRSETIPDAPRRRLWLCGAGAVLAAMNLTHPLTLLFSAAEVGLELFRRNLRRAAALAAVPAVLVGGFCIAQSVHYRRLCGIQANAGFNLYLGNNPDATGGCYLRPGKRWRRVHRDAALEAKRRGISADAVFLERAGKFWLRSPGRALRLWGAKALKVFSPSELPSGCDVPPILYFSNLMFCGLLLMPALAVLAGFGLWRIFRTRAASRAVHYLLLFFSLYAAQIVTVTSGRYRMLMIVPAALFVGAGVRDFRWRRYWFVFPLAIVCCGILTVTDYGKRRGEAATLYAEAALNKQDFRQAEALAAYALRAPDNPDPAHCWELRGAAAENLSRIALAGSVRAAERNGGLAAELRREAQRRIDFAGSCYRRMTEVEPDFCRGWMHLAIFAEDSGDRERAGSWYEQAEKWYGKALELEPAAPDVCYNYARFRFRTGRPCGEAVAAALKAAPLWSRPWRLAGIVAVRDREFRRAADCFWRAMELAPDEETRKLNLESLRYAEHLLRNSK